MTTTHSTFLAFTAFIGVVLLSACSSTPVAPTSIATASATANTPQPVAIVAAPSAKSQPVVSNTLPAHLDANSAISKSRSIYFDFDQFVVKPEFMRGLELQGKYLANNPKIVIKIEGNTDEQGGVEYNLALGQKRAEAVTKVLRIFGARDSQLEAVSFGKEKPKASGHDETARKQNRRADLSYPKY